MSPVTTQVDEVEFELEQLTIDEAGAELGLACCFPGSCCDCAAQDG